MANEELIYRLTRAVYERLGASTDESVVEQLVTDIYRTIEPELAVNGAARISRSGSAGDSFSQADTRAGSADRLVISVSVCASMPSVKTCSMRCIGFEGGKW